MEVSERCCRTPHTTRVGFACPSCDEASGDSAERVSQAERRGARLRAGAFLVALLVARLRAVPLLFGLARDAAFLAGVRFLLARLFCNSDMKSTTLVLAFSGVSDSSSSTGVTTPLDFMRF